MNQIKQHPVPWHLKVVDGQAVVPKSFEWIENGSNIIVQLPRKVPTSLRWTLTNRHATHTLHVRVNHGATTIHIAPNGGSHTWTRFTHASPLHLELAWVHCDQRKRRVHIGALTTTLILHGLKHPVVHERRQHGYDQESKHARHHHTLKHGGNETMRAREQRLLISELQAAHMLLPEERPSFSNETIQAVRNLLAEYKQRAPEPLLNALQDVVQAFPQLKDSLQSIPVNSINAENRTLLRAALRWVRRFTKRVQGRMPLTKDRFHPFYTVLLENEQGILTDAVDFDDWLDWLGVASSVSVWQLGSDGQRPDEQQPVFKLPDSGVWAERSILNVLTHPGLYLRVTPQHSMPIGSYLGMSQLHGAEERIYSIKPISSIVDATIFTRSVTQRMELWWMRMFLVLGSKRPIVWSTMVEQSMEPRACRRLIDKIQHMLASSGSVRLAITRALPDVLLRLLFMTRDILQHDTLLTHSLTRRLRVSQEALQLLSIQHRDNLITQAALDEHIHMIFEYWSKQDSVTLLHALPNNLFRVLIDPTTMSDVTRRVNLLGALIHTRTVQPNRQADGHIIWPIAAVMAFTRAVSNVAHDTKSDLLNAMIRMHLTTAEQNPMPVVLTWLATLYDGVLRHEANSKQAMPAKAVDEYVGDAFDYMHFLLVQTECDLASIMLLHKYMRQHHPVLFANIDERLNSFLQHRLLETGIVERKQIDDTDVNWTDHQIQVITDARSQTIIPFPVRGGSADLIAKLSRQDIQWLTTVAQGWSEDVQQLVRCLIVSYGELTTTAETAERMQFGQRLWKELQSTPLYVLGSEQTANPYTFVLFENEQGRLIEYIPWETYTMYFFVRPMQWNRTVDALWPCFQLDKSKVWVNHTLLTTVTRPGRYRLTRIVEMGEHPYPIVLKLTDDTRVPIYTATLVHTPLDDTRVATAIDRRPHLWWLTLFPAANTTTHRQIWTWMVQRGTDQAQAALVAVVDNWYVNRAPDSNALNPPPLFPYLPESLQRQVLHVSIWAIMSDTNFENRRRYAQMLYDMLHLDEISFELNRTSIATTQLTNHWNQVCLKLAQMSIAIPRSILSLASIVEKSPEPFLGQQQQQQQPIQKTMDEYDTLFHDIHVRRFVKHELSRNVLRSNDIKVQQSALHTVQDMMNFQFQMVHPNARQAVWLTWLEVTFEIVHRWEEASSHHQLHLANVPKFLVHMWKGLKDALVKHKTSIDMVSVQDSVYILRHVHKTWYRFIREELQQHAYHESKIITVPNRNVDMNTDEEPNRQVAAAMQDEDEWNNLSNAAENDWPDLSSLEDLSAMNVVGDHSDSEMRDAGGGERRRRQQQQQVQQRMRRM